MSAPKKSPNSLFLTRENMVLATDLYQLTMMAAYLEFEMSEPATFELFVRRLPRHRAFLVSAGLEQCIQYLSELTFDGDDIDFLRAHEVFANISGRFFERLRAWKFSGNVAGIPEGVPFFPNEAILQIRAPLFEAQLIETYLLSTINYQVSVASKAARVAMAAGDRTCVDFGSRRAHGPQAGVYAARASYIGGMVATSNLLAGKLCGIPVTGTAAHAFTMACPSEDEAFRRYHAAFPDHTTLLIDTYDTLRGAVRATHISGELKGVRLDSGDLAQLSKEVRLILDAEGRDSTRIVASGDLNEYKIRALLDEGAKIDAFGVGTEMVTSKDHPALGGVYKLVSRQVAGVEQAAMKLSPGKATYPGIKQFWRERDDVGRCVRDVMQLASTGAPSPRATPLLVPIFERGECVYSLPDITATRARCQTEIASLPESLLTIEGFGEYPVEVGADVSELMVRLRAEVGE